MKSSLFNHNLISFQSGFSPFLLKSAITGSKANFTASGGFAYALNSSNYPFWIPETLSWAAINAGSAFPKSSSTFTFLSAISLYFCTKLEAAFYDISFYFSA